MEQHGVIALAVRSVSEPRYAPGMTYPYFETLPSDRLSGAHTLDAPLTIGRHYTRSGIFGGRHRVAPEDTPTADAMRDVARVTNAGAPSHHARVGSNRTAYRLRLPAHAPPGSVRDTDPSPHFLPTSG